MATNKYVPPAFRNANKNRFSSLDERPIPKQEDFPTLGATQAPPTTHWKTKKSFAVMATEWNDHSEYEKMRGEYSTAKEKREAAIRERDMRNIVPFQPHRSPGEIREDESELMAEPVEHDEWKTIERKARREYSDEEKHAREEAREAEEKARQAQEDSVWNSSNADDWDYRDRRTIN
jgi:hypothetical protein